MGNYQIAGTINQNCITGADHELGNYLKAAIARAVAMDFNVSFLMKSGVDLILPELQAAVARGAAIRILCGNYLNITQPEALYLLRDALGEQLDLRFYAVPNHSFHPKAYFFRYPDYEEVFVGSSNLSRSALTTGIEWNYRINSREQPADCAFFRKSFDDLLANFSIAIDDERLRNYARQWVRPQLYRQLEETKDDRDVTDSQPKVAEPAADYDVVSRDQGEMIAFPQPIGAQIEALYALKQFRLEGLDKGLVVAATGIGKTFLAAFDSRGFERILFVAHREEMLTQAQASFGCVHPDRRSGFFCGSEKDTTAEIIFASVQTLGNPAYLNDRWFAPDAFDYLIIDEFHHAVSDYYQNLLDYFRPRFLLGLTATPERLDNQDVFALCDYNVVYEIRLKEAINRGWLAPFHYYGIYDELDYDQVAYRSGQYDDDQLEKLASVNRRGNLIFMNYQKFRSTRALGFCINRNHALYMADYFRNQGVPCCAVISGAIPADRQELVLDRETAVKQLKVGALKVVFSVDMFNEGLDIPELDLVMFLRPTQSPTVFLQQLGRGLRKTRGKAYVNVLDFIGNYKKANLIPFFLTGEPQIGGSSRSGLRLPTEADYPQECFIDFDFRLIDLFAKMQRDQQRIEDRIGAEFMRIADLLGHRPTRLDFYIHLEPALWDVVRRKTALNPFRDYLRFLEQMGQANAGEKALLGSAGHRFLTMLENTSMSKTYKMPVLLAFFNGGAMKLAIDDDDLFDSFRSFYQNRSNRIDLLRDKSTAGVATWKKQDYVALANRNPVHFLAQTAGEFFYRADGKFCLAPEMEPFLTEPDFVGHVKDIIDYRTKRFYRERLEKLEGQKQ